MHRKNKDRVRKNKTLQDRMKIFFKFFFEIEITKVLYEKRERRGEVSLLTSHKVLNSNPGIEERGEQR